jgi:hypothetical protein
MPRRIVGCSVFSGANVLAVALKTPESDFYVHENWSLERVLPWSHLQGPLPVATLQKYLAAATALFPQ